MDLFSASIKMICALSFILAGILLTLYLLKKFFPGMNKIFGKDKLIKVIASDYLGIKKSIVLVDVAGEVLVVGVSNNNISLLSKIDNKDVLARFNKDEKEKKTFSRSLSKEGSG